jgi:Divergent InlB B-repeat domain
MSKTVARAAKLVRIVTSRRLPVVLAVAILAAGVSVSTASSLVPIRRVVLVVITGKGKVTSAPHGIACPRTCRGVFPKDSQVHLVAHPAAGWRLSRWSGQCTGARACAFYLTTEHECSAQLCKVGAFGVRVAFVRR